MYKYKHPDKAIEDFTKVIEISEKVYEAWLGRADAKKKKGDLEGAVVDYTQAIAIDPAYAPYYGRSVCKKKLGDSEGAFEDMKLAKEAGIR